MSDKTYKVLIVENSVVSRLVIKKTLLMSGLHFESISEVSDGLEALEFLKNNA
jgi:CheY-like chemotaxis protein